MAKQTQNLKDMKEALRNAGFSVSHNAGCLENAADECPEPERELDEGYWTEFVHTTYLQYDFFNRSVGDHHVLCKNEECRELAREISQKLFDLYQLAGTESARFQIDKKRQEKGEAFFNDRD